MGIQNMDKVFNKIVALYILIAIIFFSIGVSASIFISGLIKAQKLAEKSEVVAPEPIAPQAESPSVKAQKIIVPDIIYNLTGTVQNIEENSIILKANIPHLNEANQPVQRTETRKIVIGPTTNFSRLNFVAQKESGRKAIQESTITFQELKAGDHIEVIAREDITKSEEFEAAQVRILP